MTDPFEIEIAIKKASAAVFSRSDVDAILAELSAHLEIDVLRLDKDGAVWLTVDEEIDVALLHLPHFPGLILAVPMPEDAADNGVVLRQLLRANMSWRQTHGGSFGILPHSDRPMLCRFVPLHGCDSKSLDRHIAEFVELAQGWYHDISLYLDIPEDRQGESAAKRSSPGLPPLQRV